MSDQEFGKKESELSELYPFLEAYELVTGIALSNIIPYESPDFVCCRPNGTNVGIELTKVTRNPDDIFGERVLRGNEEIAPDEALWHIYHLIEKKEKSRSTQYGRCVNENILVLQLVDGSLASLLWIFEGLQEDFSDHGFYEIWLADYSGIEPYGGIELFGLYPEHWWGHHQRPRGKPYG